MRKVLFAVCLAAFALTPRAAQAQIGLGPQASIAEDADFGLGARATFGLPAKIPLEIIASADYFFPEEDVDYWELNGEVVWLIPVTAPTVDPYAGAGINIAHASIEGGESDTEVGLNLLGGLKLHVGPVTPFGEFRFELDGGEQFVVTFGVLFGLGPM
jgi:hypothetical protein